MEIPSELLTYIASELNSIDLSNFRLTNRKCAQAAISLIPRHGISVINMSRYINELQDILRCPAIANNVRTLTIFHAEWPIFSRHEWEEYCFGDAIPSRQLDRGFSTYEEVITGQQDSSYSQLNQLVTMLPNLTTIQVSNIDIHILNPRLRRQFRKFLASIWCSRLYPYYMKRPVEAVLAVSTRHVKALYISGKFDPRELNIGQPYSYIQHLRIHNFRVDENQTWIRRFLQGFPELHILSVSFDGWDPSVDIFQSLHWPKLKQLDIRKLWTS